MKDRWNPEDLRLPPELAELHEELSSLSLGERPSFGPELHAELDRAWLTVAVRRIWPVRQLLAASVAGLLMVGLGVPSARASLVRLVETLRPEVQAPEPEVAPPTFELPAEPSVTLPPEDEPAPERRLPSEPPPAPALPAPYSGPEATFPDLLDREEARELILRNYPAELQQEGIGGTVRLLLWVDSLGSVELVDFSRGSGVPDLDRAAMEVAPLLRFSPARRRGEAVGTWVEFDVRFEVPPGGIVPVPLPEVDPLGLPQVPDVPDLSLTEEWIANLMTRPDEGEGEAVEELRVALDDDDLVARLGPIEAILQGEPPAGSAPTRWRSEVTRALETAAARDPDNPAPLLALGRIRQRQGLRTEARILLERGLQRAQRSPGVSRTLLGELHYERGALIKEAWMASHQGGYLPAEALPGGACPQARSSGGAASGIASADRLIAWNYLCPEALGEAFRGHFQEADRDANGEPALMMASFRAAVEAVPAHPEANREILLALAEEGRWREVVEGARRFATASQGHPHALLLEGLALQRLARNEAARNRFELAFLTLPAEQAGAIRDVAPVLRPDEERRYLSTTGEARRLWQETFWAPLDPILLTEVNEREVEHWARAAEAFLRFGAFDTDPAEVWVRYGAPLDIRVVSEGPGPKTEFWDYGSGPDVTFSRMGSLGEMDLTSEGRAYLDDLRQILPHRYGPASRMVFTLPAQVSRFRGASAGVRDVQAQAWVPADLATGGRDSLEVGLFLLDGEGDVVSEWRSRVPAVRAPLSLRATADPTVEGVVVELFHTGAGRAASVREGVAAMQKDVVTASDLVVVRAAAPDGRDVLRDAPWLEPYALDGTETSPAVGMFFELYDVEGEASWYRLRAEVEDQETGTVIGLPIRPAGERGFRPTWDRRPAPGEVTVEFVTAALHEVPSGTYALRMIVDLPEAGMPLVLQRTLVRR